MVCGHILWCLVLPYFYVDEEIKFVLDRVAQLRFMTYAGFLRFVKEMFRCTLDGIDDQENDLAFLRQKYGNWTLTVGSGEGE